MSERPRIPPSHYALTRFFREQHPRSLREVAALVGWTRAQVKQQAMDQRVLLRGNLVGWRDAASWLIESWPIAALVKTLGPDASLLPAGLHPIPLLLEQPAYIVHALRVQSTRERMPHRMVRPATFAEYMTDLLHRAIEPETVAALRTDEEFMRAYDFPGGEER